MKTFARLIRRYVLALTALTLVLAGLGVALLGWLGWQYTTHYQDQPYTSGEIAAAMVQQEGELDFGPAHTPEQWMQGYAWAMVLDDGGQVIWRYQLPPELDHPYTASEIAAFSRWYLDEWPVLCWVEEYGLFVIGQAPGTLWKRNLYMDTDIVRRVISGILPAGAGLVALILAFCLAFSWRGSRSLQQVAQGLDALAEGETVTLPVTGMAGELAQKLNQTSAQLQARNEIIARRDSARTNWIAGVSHDIRTPLSLILGWAEQLEQDPALPESARHKAGGIRTQSQRIRSLIDDLNLTSKLQYGAQPLRRQKLTAGPLLRRAVADFYDTPLADHCTVSLAQTDAAEQAVLDADPALLARALENLLNNAARHNPDPVEVRISAEMDGGKLRIILADDGVGYPPAVLRALSCPEQEGAPHILGLHVVEQILSAHGGRAVFLRNRPQGAKAVLVLPVTREE